MSNEAAVQSWFCMCRAGARVVGMCSHIASVMWFLGYARHRFVNVADLDVRDWARHIEDAAQLPQTESEDDSESDEA